MKTITLKDLATELGMDRSHMRRFVLALGIQPVRVRTASSRNQATLAITVEEAEQVRQERSQAGFIVNQARQSDAISDGVLYAIILDPEARPGRVKLGFSNGIAGRLATYRTSNPSAKVAGQWPCKRSWEPAAIAAITNVPGCEHVAGEVYDCRDVATLIEQGKQFFALLPTTGERAD